MLVLFLPILKLERSSIMLLFFTERWNVIVLKLLRWFVIVSVVRWIVIVFVLKSRRCNFWIEGSELLFVKHLTLRCMMFLKWSLVIFWINYSCSRLEHISCWAGWQWPEEYCHCPLGCLDNTSAYFCRWIEKSYIKKNRACCDWIWSCTACFTVNSY